MPTPQIPPTPDELRAFMAKYRLTQTQFADLIPKSISTVEKWLMGERTPEPSLRRILNDIERELS